MVGMAFSRYPASKVDIEVPLATSIHLQIRQCVVAFAKGAIVVAPHHMEFVNIGHARRPC